MNISDEAVEAAAKAIQGVIHPAQADIVGPYVTSEIQARAALEAAAPHLMAEALDQAAMDFELSPHNSKAKMARHFTNAYVGKLRERAYKIRKDAL